MIHAPSAPQRVPSESDTFILRALTLADAENAAAVIRASFAAQSRATDPPSSALRETANSIAAKIAGGGGFGLFERERLIAAALWQVDGDALVIGRVCALPDARGAVLEPNTDRRLRSRRENARPGAAEAPGAARAAGERGAVCRPGLRPRSRRGAYGLRRADRRRPREAALVSDRLALEAAPGRLTIDLAALADNWRTLARRAAPGRCAAVVKADAYGIGLDRAGPALWAAGARTFFVAHLSEGFAARRILPEEAEIYLLNGLEAGADPADYAAHRLKPAIGSAEELSRWTAFAARRGRLSPCALHLDTGMRRLGFDSLEALKIAMARDGAASGADLLMSHFVSSEISDDPLNRLQIDLFAAARAAFPHLAASLANSSGIFLPERPIYDLARPGYALYGGNPTPGRTNPMRPVATLTVAVQQTRWIEAGVPCGYNAQWTANGAPASPRSQSDTPTACRGAPARPTPGQARRSPSRAAAARWSGACRWTLRSPTSPTCRNRRSAQEPGRSCSARLSNSTILRRGAGRSATSF